MLKKGETYKVKVDVGSRVQKVTEALKKAQETLTVQSNQLRELGESEAADAAASRAKSIEEFLNK